MGEDKNIGYNESADEHRPQMGAETAKMLVDRLEHDTVVYNAGTGEVLLPDVSEYDPVADVKGNFDVIDGLKYYGVQTVQLDPPLAAKLDAEGAGMLWDYCMSNYPASGTVAENRMGFMDRDSVEDYLKENPVGWICEQTVPAKGDIVPTPVRTQEHTSPKTVR